MPYESYWLVPDQIQYTKWFGEVNEADLEKFISDVMQAIENTQGRYVHNITTTQNATGIVPIQKSVGMAAEMVNHPKCGHIVMVSNIPGLFQFPIVLFMKVLNVRYRSENSLEKAIAYLQQADPSLPQTIDLPPDIL